MFKKNGIFYFKSFLRFPSIIHGFSTRKFGSMRALGQPESLKKFASALKIPPAPFLKGEHQNIVRMNQVHSVNVRWVSEGNVLGVDDTDGVLTSEKELFLSVVTADCVPVFLYDKEKQLVGAVHAGWRGVYKEIVKKAVEELITGGSDPADIIVGIGPCIRSCCYEIAEKHAEMFRSKFTHWDDALIARDGKIFLDLPKLVQYQLQSVDIPATNMEDAGICAFESEELFSFRREGEGFGEFVGVIGRTER